MPSRGDPRSAGPSCPPHNELRPVTARSRSSSRVRQQRRRLKRPRRRSLRRDSVWLPALLEAGLAHRNEKKRIVADFKFHWLRHTAISLMCRAGMKPELIAQRVGHSDGGALIYRRYRHLFPSELRDAVGLVDELVRSARGQEVVTASL